MEKKKKKFTESNAKIPQAVVDALKTKGVQVIGIQAAEVEVSELKGCTIEIGTKGSSIKGAEIDFVLRRPLTSSSQFLALKPAGDNGDSQVNVAAVITMFELDKKRKAMALAEERVKSTLQGLEAMIKASEAQDAGVRPEVARKKWEMRSQLGLKGLAAPLACVAWEMGPEMEPILEEDRWAGDGEAPKVKRKLGCFSHAGQKRQRREEEEQLKDLIGSYTVKVVKIKEDEFPCMVASWLLSHTSKGLLKEMSFQRMQRGEGQDVTVKLEGALDGSSLKLTCEKDTEFSNSYNFMLGILCPEKQQILLSSADLFTTSVDQPLVETSEEGKADKAYADQRRRVTEGFGTDKKVRQNNLMRERIERNCEVADSEKIQTLVKANVAEQQQEKMPPWEKQKIAREKMLPPFLDDWDHARDIYRDGLEFIASQQNYKYEKKLLEESTLPLLELKAPELEKLDASKTNDVEACGSHLVLQVLKARGVQQAKVPDDLNNFAKQLGVLQILVKILKDRNLHKKREGLCTTRQLKTLTRLSTESKLFWQLFYYLFDEIPGKSSDEERCVHKIRTQCAAVIWALNLIPDCWIDVPVDAQEEIACTFSKSKSSGTSADAAAAKKIFQLVGCSIEKKKDDSTFRAALRNRPGQL